MSDKVSAKSTTYYTYFVTKVGLSSRQCSIYTLHICPVKRRSHCTDWTGRRTPSSSFHAVQSERCECPLGGGPTCTAATYEMTAVHDLQADYPSWRRAIPSQQSSRRQRCNSCATIHRHCTLCSFVLTAGRCRDHKWWTSCRCCIWMNHRRYLSTQPHASCSWLLPTVLRTYCTRRTTSCWCCYVTAGRTSACSSRSVLAHWADHFQPSSCRWSRWNWLWTPPMNGWRIWSVGPIDVLLD